jgi:hypothetical protein
MKDEYLLAHIQRVLAEHGSELGVDVARRDEEFVLTGDVESEQRRQEVERIVAEHVPQARVRNEIRITRVGTPDDAELLSARVPVNGGEGK